MRASDVISTLQARGVTLQADGDNLRIKGASRLTAEEKTVIKAHKTALLKALATPPISPTATASQEPSLALRRIEVTRLDVTDVNLDAGTIAVLGKGRTSKEPLTLPEHAKEVLSDWLKVRGSAFGPLFINLDRARKGKDNRLTTKSIWQVIVDLGKKSEVKVRPHGLRHAAITNALDLTDGNVRAVARFSRHKNLQVLTVYNDNRQDLGGAVARLVSEKALLNGGDS